MGALPDSLNILAGKLLYALEECFQYVCITRTSFPMMLCNCEISILSIFLVAFLDPLFSLQYAADESSDFNGGRVG